MSDPSTLRLAGFDEETLRAFVSELYPMFLGRPADPAGLAYFVGELRDGAPLFAILAAMAAAPEFREKSRRDLIQEFADERDDDPGASPVPETPGPPSPRFPLTYQPAGESSRSYKQRVRSGFFRRYCSGPVVLDVGFTGADNPERKTAVPGAIGVDVDYPGYDGIHLPFEAASVDTVFSSHCLEHILYDHAAIHDWYRTLKVGGFIVCIVPSQALYEKRRFLPSRFNADHKRTYTPASLLASFEYALETNAYRVRHLAENDQGYSYAIGPELHPVGAYEIELVIEKIDPPSWRLA